jgi:exodeoxyribonuclease VII large subunit
VPKKRHIYTVSELTREIKATLEERFPAVWVEGELSNLKRPGSGHIYFSLKDQTSILKAALFKNTNKDLKFQLKDGMQVVCFGKIDLYAPQGQHQIKVFKIEPKGVGALQVAFEQLKGRLAQEGLFDPRHKKPIPFLPQRIGVVTSPTGAVIRDILQILNRRFANLEITLYPVRVQGEGAGGEIAQAIDDFNRYGRVDVLIVSRGGGSLEDLWAFNEEAVARAIYRSGIPVISAVGHEIDYTISDFVADLRAATPSAAAELVIAKKQELLEQIEKLFSRAQRSLMNQVELLQHRYDNLKERYAFRQPADLIEQYQQTIDQLLSTLDLKVKHLLQIHRERYNALGGKLHTLSPLNILSRGYSITLGLPEREVITRADTLKPGRKIETQVAKGSFVSKVERIRGEQDD